MVPLPLLGIFLKPVLNSEPVSVQSAWAGLDWAGLVQLQVRGHLLPLPTMLWALNSPHPLHCRDKHSAWSDVWPSHGVRGHPGRTRRCWFLSTASPCPQHGSPGPCCFLGHALALGYPNLFPTPEDFPCTKGRALRASRETT